MFSRKFLVPAFGLLAGFFSLLLGKLLSTGDWLAKLPWHQPAFPRVPELPVQVLQIVLAVVTAWTAFAVRGGLRLWLLILAGLVLCFTADASLARHGLSFDSFQPVLAILCGTLIGTLLAESDLGAQDALVSAFGGENQQTVGSFVIQQLAETDPTGAKLELADRFASVVTCRLHNPADFQKTVAPEHYHELVSRLENHLRGVFLRRGAFVPASGSFTTFQAFFGVPHTEGEAECQAVESAEIVRESLEEVFGETSPPLRFSLSVVTDYITCGVRDGRYQAFGPLAEAGRDAALPSSTAASISGAPGPAPIYLDEATAVVLAGQIFVAAVPHPLSGGVLLRMLPGPPKEGEPAVAAATKEATPATPSSPPPAKAPKVPVSLPKPKSAPMAPEAPSAPVAPTGSSEQAATEDAAPIQITPRGLPDRKKTTLPPPRGNKRTPMPGVATKTKGDLIKELNEGISPVTATDAQPAPAALPEPAESEDVSPATEEFERKAIAEWLRSKRVKVTLRTAADVAAGEDSQAGTAEPKSDA